MASVSTESKQLRKSLRFPPGSTVAVYAPNAAHLPALLGEAFPDGHFLTLTYDLKDAEAAQARVAARGCRNVSVHTGDTLDALGETDLDAVVLRPSGWEGNEKLRSLLAQSLRMLRAGGNLYLVTYMRRGAPSQMRMVQERFGSYEIVERAGTGLRIVRAAKPEAAASGDPSEPAPAPDEGGEGHLIEAEVLGLRLTFRTAPGVFSHRRLDEGTVLLLETLGGGSIEGKKAVADLGCGYGPIGIALAARYPHLQVTMVDVDARAVSLAQSNAALNGVAPRTRVLVSDGLGRFPGGAFDAVVIAFPLHIPKGEQVRLLTESREALRVGGAIYLAALCEYDIRPTVQTVFGNVETLAETPIGAANRYRVLRAHT